MSLSNRTCIVTGANTGLGFHVAKGLAARGADTTLLCRSREKGERAVQAIRAALPDASVALAVCDLSSLRSVRDFIAHFKATHASLDLLYNNAAVMKSKRTTTEDGFEMMFQVNYLAAFVLMTSLLGLLRNGSSPGIINNGRPSAKLRLDLDDLQAKKRYGMYRSFFRTKLCLVFATMELARRPERDGVAVTMVDPGTFKSELVRDVKLGAWFKNLLSSPVEKAAGNILYHTDPAAMASRNGKVFREQKEYPVPEYWQEASVAQRLWSLTESMLEGRAH
ncbi:MAG: SDR family NAD(P)-dependent oxidoreductase [Gemmatimonadota bacterium]